ncbi:MAG TPA: nucleoside triphosphate pyrophosphatase [Candidatus Binataceae bacterium]|jgi:septum formation protein|nr:nucleoside triphosphate pyrophosphatase [Candidatus Binataceae bacterium]
MDSNRKLILASGSPRRRELLNRAQIDFEVIQSGIDEIRRPGESGSEYAPRMAREKALAVSTQHPNRIVLAADTIVVCDGDILEKPRDASDASRMLAALSGRTHTVITAFAIASDGKILASEAVASQVTFRELSVKEIANYIATGEPFDKAGAYGIQGIGGGFISHVEGSRDNVMGLPTDEVIATLSKLGIA